MKSKSCCPVYWNNVTYAMMKNFLIFLLLSLFVFACGDKSNKSSMVDTAVIKINGEEIKNSELIDFAYFTIQEMEPAALRNKELQDRIIQNFVIHKLLVDEAKRRKLDVDNERIEKITQYIEELHQGKEAEENDKQVDNFIKEQMKKQMIESVLVQRLLSEIADNHINLEESDLRQYYDNNPQLFSGRRTANVYMILAADEVKAKLAAAELEEGLPFAEVAERYSISDEKSNGGNLGWISAEDYPDVFEEAFKLSPGETSDIIKSEYGFHIFKVLAFKDNENKKFDEVKSQIYAKLYSEKQEESVKEFIDEIYNKAEIVYINTPSFESFFAGSRSDN